MGVIKAAIDSALRDFTTDGVPASGLHEVNKKDVRALGPLIESAIGNAALGSLVDVAYATRAELDADLAHAAGSVGLVYADSTDANNDLYVKTGASGAGAWTLTTAFHDMFDSLVENDHNWLGVQSYSQDIYIGTARVGRTAGNIRFGNNAIIGDATGADNVAIGDDALAALTSGNRNNAIGMNAGQSITTGSFNVFAGYAGLNVTTGDFNVFIGPAAGNATTTTSSNVAIGINAMENAVGCNECVAIGPQALRAGNGRQGVVAIGIGALQSVTTGNGNIGVGFNAGSATTTGIFNAAFGYEALVANVTGNYNSAFGNYALDANEGSRNTGVGNEAGYRQKAGNDNVFMGHKAGRSTDGASTYYDASRCVVIGSLAMELGIDTGADDSTALGYRALHNASGANNVAIGSGAGDSITTGANNIVIGKDADTDAPTDSNRIVIGTSSHTHVSMAGVTFTKAKLEALAA